MPKRVVHSWQPISLHWPSLTNKRGRVIALCATMPTTALKRSLPESKVPRCHRCSLRTYRSHLAAAKFLISSGRRRCWRLRCTLLYIRIQRLLQLHIATGKKKENTLKRTEHGYPSTTLNLALVFNNLLSAGGSAVVLSFFESVFSIDHDADSVPSASQGISKAMTTWSTAWPRPVIFCQKIANRVRILLPTALVKCGR